MQLYRRGGGVKSLKRLGRERGPKGGGGGDTGGGDVKELHIQKNKTGTPEKRQRTWEFSGH